MVHLGNYLDTDALSKLIENWQNPRFIADNEGGNQEQSILRPIFYRLEAHSRLSRTLWAPLTRTSSSDFFSITYIIKKCQAVTKKDYCRDVFLLKFPQRKNWDFLLLDDWGQRMFLWNEGIFHKKGDIRFQISRILVQIFHF